MAPDAWVSGASFSGQTMTNMQCLRDHSSVVWGSVSAGDVFEVADGYADQLEAAGLAARIQKEPPPMTPMSQSVPEYPRRPGRPRKS